MSKLKYWLWLSAAERVSVGAKAKLILHYGDAEAAFNAPRGDFRRIVGVSKAEADILEQRQLDRAFEVMEDCRLQGITMLTMQDAAYPGRLKNICAPPVVLYLKGSLPAMNEEAAIAVIGTRKASSYGLKMGRKLAYEIACCGGVVVSGLTDGVDAAAAQGAIDAGGVCVGVLGTSHEEEHSSLSADVAKRGALISEYPPKTASQRSFFRDRNRISSGISVGVVVVEAPEKSGTRLFVSEAAEQGKEIFAVPGNADSVNSAGSNAMLKEGAKPVTDGREVMEEFVSLYPRRLKIPRELAAPPDLAEKTEDKNESSAKKDIDNKKSTGYIDLKEQLSSLSEEQLRIITVIEKKSSHVDDIIEATGMSASNVLSQLTLLEIQGYVRREPGKRYALNTAKK